MAQRWRAMAMVVLVAAVAGGLLAVEFLAGQEGRPAAEPAAAAKTGALPPAAGDTAGAAAGAERVTVVTPQRRQIARAVEVTGTLIAREEVMVGPEIEGLRIASLEADVGDQVEQGEVLARLSGQTLEAQAAQRAASIERAEAGIARAQADIAQAEATLAEAEAQLKRTRYLIDKGATSGAQLDRDVAAAATARAQLAAARQSLKVAEAEARVARAEAAELDVRLGQTVITAPAAGIIAARPAAVGAIASGAGEPLFRIIRNGEVEMQARVIDSDLAALEVGAEARITVAGLPPVPATLRRIEPEIDPNTRLGTVRLSPAPGAPGLRVGAFARATIAGGQTTGLAIPNAALISDAGGTRVQVVEDGVVQERSVQVLSLADGVVLIGDGLAPEARVVARAAAFLQPGQPVTPVPAEAQALLD